MRSARRPLLLLVPHLEWPPRNGADLTQDALAESLSLHLPYVDVVGMREVVRYEGGSATARTPFENRLRSRSTAALRTLLRGSHYFAERFNTPAFAREARKHLRDRRYGAVLHSYLSTAALAALPDARVHHLVYTHNDEFVWFSDQARNGVLSRLVARSSSRWLRRFSARHAPHLTLLHVSEADDAGWRRHVPACRSRVVPLGARLPEDVAPPLAAHAPLNLLFVGALGVKMNLDALVHFAERFEPTLRQRFGDRFSVSVAGSSPMASVVDLCAQRGWALHPDLSEEALGKQLARATFTLLPFAYATGAKLKLLTSLARGVPFLGTAAVHAQAHLVVPPCLLSDDPEDWAKRLAEAAQRGIDAATRNRLRTVAEAHSWGASAARILALLDDTLPSVS